MSERLIAADGGRRYWTVDGDAAAALGLIREWLHANGRERLPLFVAGESYGGYRLGTMARDMTDLNVAGLLLISPVLDLGEAPDQAAIDRLPKMAVAAWHRHRPAGDTLDVAAVWEEERGFAQGTCAPAPHPGHALDAAGRARIAGRVAALTGLRVVSLTPASLAVLAGAPCRTSAMAAEVADRGCTAASHGLAAMRAYGRSARDPSSASSPPRRSRPGR